VSTPTAELSPVAPARLGPLRSAAFTTRWTPPRLYLALIAGALALGALSLLLPSTPSYDPWSWLIWGRQVIHLDLQTTGGPTWKPLGVLLTTIFALFGTAQPSLLLVVSRAGALMAIAMTFRVAWRIARPLVTEWTGGEATGWALLPALLAATVAAASLVNSPSFLTDNWLGYSEGLMTALVLIAVDRHLDGARRQAFVVGFFAALDRPELWILWGPYGLYLWWKDPGARKLVAALFVLIPVLWFLPEYWGSGHLFRGVTRAHHPRSNSAAFAKCPFCTEFIHHAWPRVMFRVKAVGLIAIAVAAFGLWRTRRAWWRTSPITPGARARLLLVLAGALGWIWWIGVSVETQLGFSGNDRYLVLGTALVAISGGAGWGWAAAAVAGLLRRFRPPNVRRRAPGIVGTSGAATAAALAVGIAVPPWIGPSLIDVQATHGALVYQAHLRQDMNTAIRELGGSKQVLACGTVMTEGFQVPMLAYDLGVRMLRVEAQPTPPPGRLAPGPAPDVIFQARDTRRAALLPRPAQIIAWEHDGAHYSVRRIRTFYVFSACGFKAAS
jgi:hypothetical protein